LILKGILMRKSLILLLLFFTPLGYCYDDNGLINTKAANSVKKTADRLESLLKEKGMTIFARINHAANAKRIDNMLRPTELFIFGNPKVGAPLMQCQQTIAIDLPLKMIIWKDKVGQVWMTYNDPKYLAHRHQLADCAEKVIKMITGKLSGIVREVAKP
jgi:uncharacterized protein (DUF302 family)